MRLRRRAGEHRRAIEQPHVVGFAGAGDKRDRVSGDGGEFGRVEAHRAVEGLVVLDVELWFTFGVHTSVALALARASTMRSK